MTFTGEVVHNCGNYVVVAFLIDGDIIEHEYHKSMFFDEQLPPVGCRIEAKVELTGRWYWPDEPTFEAGTLPPRVRKNTVTGPEEF